MPRIFGLPALGLILAVITGLLHCSKPRTVPLYYYFLTPVPAAMERPPVVSNLRVKYDALLQEIQLTWDPVTDRMTSLPIGIYRIYIYLNGPPAEFYQQRDLYDESPTNSYLISQKPFSGSLYFVVTAYNGMVESLPGETVRLSVVP